jgi:hypothetical protein
MTLNRFIVDSSAPPSSPTPFSVVDILTGKRQATFADAVDAQDYASMLERKYPPIQHLPLRLLIREYKSAGQDCGCRGSDEDDTIKLAEAYLDALDREAVDAPGPRS